MLQRDDYLMLIEQIRNTEKNSLDQYIAEVLQPLRAGNPNLIETLYKDINYLLEGIDRPGEHDLIEQDDEFVEEGNDLKLTGYQSRLHWLEMWLHLEMAEKFMEAGPLQFCERMEDFEANFLKKPNYTPEYKAKLDKIKASLKEERRQNLNERKGFWSKIFNWDNLELKPNIGGIGINLNEIIKKRRNA